MQTRKRDPNAARRRILDAAAVAFASAGPDGARIDAIAAAAGVNKRMLYHYFGDKQALFEAVIGDRLANRSMSGNVAAVLVDGLPLAPIDLRLQVWAAIAGVATPPEHGADCRHFVAQLAAEQRQGRLRDDVPAELLAAVLVSASVLPRLLPDYAQLLGVPDDMLAQLGALLRPVVVDGNAGRAPVNRPRVRMLPDVRES